uniref:Uncharacterized protein n=1 Tax=Anguilla anguilla TaxID=7936 RepID=A0A0E9WFA3_ANGAN
MEDGQQISHEVERGWILGAEQRNGGGVPFLGRMKIFFGRILVSLDNC